MMRSASLALLLACTITPALANDTEASLGIGGLIFERNDAISMDSEDLFLSLDLVRVRYTYTNRSASPVTILVAFPLPDVPLPGKDWDWVEAAYPDWADIGMKTLVNGMPADLMRIDIARVAGKPVDDQLKARGWPIRFWEDRGLNARLKKLSADDQAELILAGLLTTDGMSSGELRPAWSVSTSFVRMQSFAPGASTTVEHSYLPSQGSSVSGGLDKGPREVTMMTADGYAGTYCVNDAFLRDYDRRRYLPGGKLNESVLPVEYTMRYLLSPGANWKGKIGRFRLTVDMGFPDRLFSLCMDGLKKISPTRFEVVKTNYEPERDLDLLFLSLVPAEGGP